MSTAVVGGGLKPVAVILDYKFHAGSVHLKKNVRPRRFCVLDDVVQSLLCDAVEV